MLQKKSIFSPSLADKRPSRTKVATAAAPTGNPHKRPKKKGMKMQFLPSPTTILVKREDKTKDGNSAGRAASSESARPRLTPSEHTAGKIRQRARHRRGNKRFNLDLVIFFNPKTIYFIDVFYASKGIAMAKNIKKILSLPTDMITVFNRNRVVLEGVECIIFCDSEKMIFRKKGLVTVEGRKLHLEELGNDNIAVLGQLTAILFSEDKE